MFRAFSFSSSGAQWLQWQPLVLPSYRGDSRAVFVVPGTNLVWYWVPVLTQVCLLLREMISSIPRHNAVCHVITSLYLSSASWRLRWLNYSFSCPVKWSSDTGSTLLLTDRDRSLSAALTAGGSLNWWVPVKGAKWDCWQGRDCRKVQGTTFLHFSIAKNLVWGVEGTLSGFAADLADPVSLDL
jgi:hypothetical protein